MRTKRFSYLLKEVRTVLDLSPGVMAFVLDISEQMYRMYESGKFDNAKDTYSKEEIHLKLVGFDMELSKKILLLRTALLKFKLSTYFYSVRAEAIKKREDADKKKGRKLHPLWKGTDIKSVKKAVKSNGSNGHNLKEKAGKK